MMAETWKSAEKRRVPFGFRFDSVHSLRYRTGCLLIQNKQ
jgi:hypothetical protein